MLIFTKEWCSPIMVSHMTYRPCNPFRFIITGLYVVLLHAAPVKAQAPQELFHHFSNELLYDTASVNALIAKGETITKDHPNSKQALGIFFEAIHRSRIIHYTDGLVNALFQSGRCYKDLGMYDPGIASFSEGLKYADQVADQSLKGKLYNGLGTCYFLKADYKQAAFYFFKVLDEIRHKRLQEPYHIAQLYNNFGYLWIQLKDSVQAYSWLKQAEQVATSHKIPSMLANIYINLGNYYYNFGNDLAKVHEYQVKALKVAQDNNDLSAQQIAIHNLGSILLDQGKPEKAIPYFRSALELKTDSDPYYSMIGEYYALSAAYYTIKDYKNAEKNILIALQKARATGAKDFIAKAYELLHLIAADTKNYEQAYRYARQYMDIKDSMINLEKTRAIRDMEIRYHTAEKDKVIVQKQLLISRQENYLKRKNTWIAIISAGSLVIIVLLVSLYRTNKNRQRLQQKQIQILRQEQEIDRLRAMMQGEEKERTRIARELHDGIGGMLVGVKMNLGVYKKEQHVKNTNKLDEIIQMLDDTSSEVRKTAHNLMPDILTRHTLSEALIIYCEHISMPEGPEIELQFHGDIDQLGKDVELVLYRIVQELIQNIIKHAQATYAVVQLVHNEQNGKLSIFVEDNGTGFNMEHPGGGYGLENLKNRVLALEGEISIASELGKNTTVYIEFDFDKLKKMNV